MNKSAGYELVSTTEEPAPPYDQVGESASNQTGGQTSEQTIGQTSEQTNDQTNDGTGEWTPTSLPTQAELRKSFPKSEATHQDVVAWINQMVRYRGETFELRTSTPDRDLRFLVGHDLETMTEEELRDMLPSDWPEQLRLLIAKDVKRYVKKRNDLHACLGVSIAVVSIPLFILVLVLFVKRR